MRRRPFLLAAMALVGLPIAFAIVLVVEALIARGRDYNYHAQFDGIDLTTDGATPALRLAVVGDSLVEGAGASDAEHSLAGQVARKVTERTGRAVHVAGFGVSGAVTADVAGSQLDEVEESGERFDAIVIEIGSNDVTHLTSLATVEHETRTMLERAVDLAPNVVLGSAGRLDSPNFLQPLRSVVVWRATHVREVQDRVASEFEDVAFMNVAEDVSPAYDANPNSNSDDEFHPSDVGYEIWARPLAELVADRVEPVEERELESVGR